MKSIKSSFLLFHLNLGFSSIEESQHLSVIKKCYWPLLELSNSTKVSIEANALTLKRIKKLDRNFFQRLRSQVQKGDIEFLASGYTQLISPIFPREITEKNLIYGNEFYQKELGIKPKTALINEMAFSENLIEIYKKMGFRSIVMDIDNFSLSLDCPKRTLYKKEFISDHDNNFINILWSDSILFQRFQRYIHGELTLDEYTQLIKKYQSPSFPYIPVYTNDAEVFDFRPGRFREEKDIQYSEWEKIYNLIDKLKEKNNLNFVHLNKVANNEDNLLEIKKSRLIKSPTTLKNPILVKKQLKYNIHRWGLTGRSDQFLNTLIFKSLNEMKEKGKFTNADWKELLALCTSDLRTHITQKKWDKVKKIVKESNFYSKPLAQSLVGTNPKNKPFSNSRNITITKNDEKYLTVETQSLSFKINLLKGGSLHFLSFKKSNLSEVIKSYGNDHFDSIEYGVDFFSNFLVSELPIDRKKITDLFVVEPKIFSTDLGTLIQFEQKLEKFNLIKEYFIEGDKAELTCSYYFRKVKKFIGSVRVGNFLINLSQNQNLKLLNSDDSKIYRFKKNLNIDHGEAVSNIVSATTALPSYSNVLSIVDEHNKGLDFQLFQHEGFSLPLIKYTDLKPSPFIRLSFSLREFDDTSKQDSNLMPFIIKIRPHFQ